MEPDLLFLRRCEQAASLTISNDHIDLLDLSNILRQILCDKHSLMDVVNKNPNIKITFHVNLPRVGPEDRINPHLAFSSMEDGLDPETAAPIYQSALVSKDEFLGLPILWIQGRAHRVLDVIGHARNVAGGTHYDPTNAKDQYRSIAAAGNVIHIGGLPSGIRQMRAIGRVTLRGLLPLIESVRLRQGMRAEELPWLDRFRRGETPES